MIKTIFFFLLILSFAVNAQDASTKNTRMEIESIYKSYNNKMLENAEAGKMLKRLYEISKNPAAANFKLEDEFLAPFKSFNDYAIERDAQIILTIRKSEPSIVAIWQIFTKESLAARTSLFRRQYTYTEYFEKIKSLSQTRDIEVAEIRRSLSTSASTQSEKSGRSSASENKEAESKNISVKWTGKKVDSIKQEIDWTKVGINLETYKNNLRGERRRDGSDVLETLIILSENSRGNSNTTALNDLRKAKRYMYGILNKAGSFDEPSPNIKDGTLNIHFLGARDFNGWCFVDFSLTNKLGFDISQNGLYGRFDGPGHAEKLGHDWLFSFKKLSNGEKISSWAMLHKKDICKYNEAGKNGMRAAGMPFDRLTLEIKDEDSLIKDGFKSLGMLRTTTNGPDTFDFKVSVTSQIDNKVAMQNPAYRELMAKRQSCVASCQSKMEACILQYNSQEMRRQVCGMPAATCMSTCDNMK